MSGSRKPEAEVAGPGSRDAFPPTRLSLIDRIRSESPEARRAGFDTLARLYWKPIYKYLRLRWHQDPPDAEDTTQAFLMTAIEGEFFERYDPARAQFRTFLRVCLDRFVQKEQRAAMAAKREGRWRRLSLDFAGAEAVLHTHGSSLGSDVEGLFERETVRAVFEGAVEALQEECREKGKLVHFQLFERYDLDPERQTYAGLADEFGLTVTQVTNYLAAARGAFRAHALHHLREASGTDEEFREDARRYFGIDVR